MSVNELEDNLFTLTCGSREYPYLPWKAMGNSKKVFQGGVG